jgi:hypothetical protein
MIAFVVWALIVLGGRAAMANIAFGGGVDEGAALRAALMQPGVDVRSADIERVVVERRPLSWNVRATLTADAARRFDNPSATQGTMATFVNGRRIQQYLARLFYGPQPRIFIDIRRADALEFVRRFNAAKQGGYVDRSTGAARQRPQGGLVRLLRRISQSPRQVPNTHSADITTVSRVLLGRTASIPTPANSAARSASVNGRWQGQITNAAMSQSTPLRSRLHLIDATSGAFAAAGPERPRALRLSGPRSPPNMSRSSLSHLRI